MGRSGRVTMKDVAKLAGVSVRTVSNVVNDYEFVSDDKRTRVKKAIDELGYMVNASARNLRRGRTGNIVLAVPDLTMPYFADLADRIIVQAHRRGLNVLVEPTLADDGGEGSALGRIRGNIADGIIYCPVFPEEQTFAGLSLGVPVVVLSEPTDGDDFDHVSIDNRGGAYAATRHLIARGCRHIAAIGLRGGHPHDRTAHRRLEGYRKALLEEGLEVDPRLEKTTEAWHRSDGARAVHGLLERGRVFDGVFAFTDQVAAGVLYELSSWGMEVPRDVAVVGFDNNSESKYFIPALTTIDPGIDRIAERAVEILARRIEAGTAVPAGPSSARDTAMAAGGGAASGVGAGSGASGPITVTVPFTLVRRESA